MPEIDSFLSFSNKKNIGIINRSSQQNTFNFLYYIIANVCISYHNKKENKKDGGKTILIDAGSGNNLQFLYLNLVNRSFSLSNSTMLVNIDNILDNIIVARAFTFYQLANIIIKEIPKIIQKLDNRLQIIVLDLLDTLSLSSSLSSSSFSYFHKKNGEETGGLIYNNSFQNNLKLLEEVIDGLIQISKGYFVIVSINDKNKLFDNNNNSNNSNNVFSKFQNAIEINISNNKSTKKMGRNNDTDLVQIKINSKDNNINKVVPIKESSILSTRTAAAKKITKYGK